MFDYNFIIFLICQIGKNVSFKSKIYKKAIYLQLYLQLFVNKPPYSILKLLIFEYFHLNLFEKNVVLLILILYNLITARLMKLVNMRDSKSRGLIILVGSTPTSGTIFLPYLKLFIYK